MVIVANVLLYAQNAIFREENFELIIAEIKQKAPQFLTEYGIAKMFPEHNKTR